MTTVIIEGDPGAIEHLLSELYDRNYLPDEFRVSCHEADPVQLIKEVVSGLNDEWSRWFDEPLLQDDEREWLERAEEFVRQAAKHDSGGLAEPDVDTPFDGWP